MPKLATPLTENQIIELAPRVSRFKLADGHGLYLTIEPTGKKKWRMDYKRHGKETCISFGSYPEVSLSEARQRCTNAWALIADEIDPVEHKRELGRLDRAARPKAPQLHFSMNAQGGMAIENKTSRLTLSAVQVAALRAFMIATNEATLGE